MRIGSLTRSFICLSAWIAAAATFSAQAESAAGQSPQEAYGPTSRHGGAIQALFNAPAGMLSKQSPYVDAHGNPIVVPAQYGEPCPCPDGGYGGYPGGEGHCPEYGPGNHYGGFSGPMPMGAGGTDPPVGYDLMEDTGIEGYMVDQRGPHYFDIRGEVVWMRPEETFGPSIAFTQDELSPTGTLVLFSDQLNYDYEPGFRIVGRYDICPLAVLEFGYMGIYDWESEATYRDPDAVPDLFSLFSRPAFQNPLLGDFGSTPGTVATAGGPAPETERALQHTIRIDTDLQSAEMSYRRYWVGYVPRISGTLLAGFRYTKMKEDFLFFSQGFEGIPPAALSYLLRADNDLVGFQTGGDIWVGLMQGLRIGAEGKVGIYNNHYTLDNVITTIPNGTTPPSLNERFRDNEVAFISEASFDVVADILPSWSLRAGYEVLFLNSILRAGENFNTGSPYQTDPDLAAQTPRFPFVAEQGHAFYHGFHAGLEFIW